jgi:hypothetical protein
MERCVHERNLRARFRNEAHELASEGEGAYLPVLANRYHLPLRGKLGWMTPRAGVKTTLASEMRLPGPPIPSGGPNFLVKYYPARSPACSFSPLGTSTILIPA